MPRTAMCSLRPDARAGATAQQCRSLPRQIEDLCCELRLRVRITRSRSPCSHLSERWTEPGLQCRAGWRVAVPRRTESLRSRAQRDVHVVDLSEVIHGARGDLALRRLPVEAGSLRLLRSHLRGVVLDDDLVVVELRELRPEGVVHLARPLLDHLRLLPCALIARVVRDEPFLCCLDGEQRRRLERAGDDLRALRATLEDLEQIVFAHLQDVEDFLQGRIDLWLRLCCRRLLHRGCGTELQFPLQQPAALLLDLQRAAQLFDLLTGIERGGGGGCGGDRLDAATRLRTCWRRGRLRRRRPRRFLRRCRLANGIAETRLRRTQ